YLGDAVNEAWDNPSVLNRAFIAYAANGDVERAADVASRLQQVNGTGLLPKLLLGTQAIKQRRYDAALRALDNMGEDSFEGITGAILKGWALTGAGRLPEAHAVLDKVGRNGLEEFLNFHRAVMAEVAGD